MNDTMPNAELAPRSIDIYSIGAVSLSVCVPQAMARAEIEHLVNIEAPTGIDSGWTISKDKAFHDGTPIPAVCENDKTRRHWLLNC